MIRKIEKEILKLEKLKQFKVNNHKQLEEEISSINLRLKELCALKKQYEKLEQGANELINKS